MKEVLFIDDNIALCEMYQKELKKYGYNLTISNNGPDALEILSDRSYDLILLDIMMEPMAGWEVLEHIRALNNGKNTSILMLTGKVPLPSEVITYGDTIQGFIMKPLYFSTLRNSLELLIAEKEEAEKILASCGDDATTHDRTSEYLKLRQQIRVWESLISTIETIFEGLPSEGQNDYSNQIQEIRDIVSVKKERYNELTTVLEKKLEQLDKQLKTDYSTRNFWE